MNKNYWILIILITLIVSLIITIGVNVQQNDMIIDLEDRVDEIDDMIRIEQN